MYTVRTSINFSVSLVVEIIERSGLTNIDCCRMIAAVWSVKFFPYYFNIPTNLFRVYVVLEVRYHDVLPERKQCNISSFGIVGTPSSFYVGEAIDVY